jgi:DNA-binding MarR family transcriptional regulator
MPGMATATARKTDDQRGIGLGVLTARLLFAFQDELYARLEQAGHGALTRLHGAVIAHLDEDGTRLTELARRSGRHKQIVGRIVDELEALGYVERLPEPGDRRAKRVVPTDRGRDVIGVSDEIIDDIERRLSGQLGKAAFDDFKHSLRAVGDSLRRPRDDAPRGGAPTTQGTGALEQGGPR